MVRLIAPLAVAAALLLAAPAGAVTRTDIARFADQVSAVWAKRQDAHGYFKDPQTGRHQGGYGNVMIGYGLLRAGVRAGNADLVKAGVRGIDTALSERPADRGVFDLLAMAAAYNFARTHLAGDPSVAAARPRWRRYLRQTGAPNTDNKAQQCILSPACFHNHEAVGATADLELLRTGLRSRRPRAQIRRGAVHEVGVAEPAFASPDLLSDTGVWPLAYHALSTAMLRRSIELLGPRAPRSARRALKRTVGALRGFMAPDGTVAYIGRRQEELWSLAAAVASGDQAVADRAFARIKADYPITDRGLPIVPREGAGAFSPRGVDGKPMTFNGLAIYLLNIAADAPLTRHGPLRSDRGGGRYVNDAQNGFATLRHGDVWFAVHRRRLPPDLRNDFGLMAAKWRNSSGAWQDILRPRPMRFDAGETAGPVVERAGQRLLPSGDSISASSTGITVRGHVGLAPAVFRYTPTRRGVRLAIQAQPGDVVAYNVYAPTAGTHIRRGAVSYPTGVVKSRPRAVVRVDHGFASCCDTRMVAARMRVRARGNGTVSFTVSAHGTRHAAPNTATSTAGGGGRIWWIGPLLAVLAVLLAAFVRRDSTYRRRRRTRA